jgi:transcriptional regulator with XRE-family HTH domain
MKQITGTQVRRIREMKSISQEYVAKHLGISQAAYSNIENGKTGISQEKLFRIAIALDVQAEAIIKFDTQVALEACMRSKSISPPTILNPKKNKRQPQKK